MINRSLGKLTLFILSVILICGIGSVFAVVWISQKKVPAPKHQSSSEHREPAPTSFSVYEGQLQSREGSFLRVRLANSSVTAGFMVNASTGIVQVIAKGGKTHEDKKSLSAIPLNASITVIVDQSSNVVRITYTD